MSTTILLQTPDYRRIERVRNGVSSPSKHSDSYGMKHTE